MDSNDEFAQFENNLKETEIYLAAIKRIYADLYEWVLALVGTIWACSAITIMRTIYDSVPDIPIAQWVSKVIPITIVSFICLVAALAGLTYHRKKMERDAYTSQ